MIASKKCGIKSVLIRFKEDISEKEILNVINNINDDFIKAILIKELKLKIFL